MALDNVGYGAVLKAARKSLRLSVAKASELVRVSPATIKRWEAGQGMPPKSDLRGYLDRLGLDNDAPARVALDSGSTPTGFRESREAFVDRPVLRFLRSKRRRQGMTLTEIAATTGLSAASIFRYETGQRSPQDDDLKAVCQAVGCTPVEFQELQTCLYSPAVDSRALDGNAIAESFLVPGNRSQLQVFALLDAILHQEQPGALEPWGAFHGLLIMGEHETVREVWPGLKPALGQQELSREDKSLFRTTLATVRSTFEPADPKTLGKLGYEVTSVRPGFAQVMSMLHLARLAMSINDFTGAETWIRAVEDYGLRIDDRGILFLAELNRRAIEFERTRSSREIAAIEEMRDKTTGALQAYNLEVALCHVHASVGDRESMLLDLERCYEAESTFGFGSPLARRIRLKQEKP